MDFERIYKEQVKTNNLLEKLIGILQAAAEPDINYLNSIDNNDKLRTPGDNIESKRYP